VFDEFSRRDKLYYSFIDEPFKEWDDKEMLTRQLMVLDLPSKNHLLTTMITSMNKILK